MGNVEIVAAVRAARGCAAASSYKMQVLLSWDIESQEPPSSANESSATGAEQRLSFNDRDLEARGKQIEISNGLILHEVASAFFCACRFFELNAYTVCLHVEMANTIGRTRVAGVLVHSAAVRSIIVPCYMK